MDSDSTPEISTCVCVWVWVWCVRVRGVCVVCVVCVCVWYIIIMLLFVVLFLNVIHSLWMRFTTPFILLLTRPLMQSASHTL